MSDIVTILGLLVVIGITLFLALFSYVVTCWVPRAYQHALTRRSGQREKPENDQ